MLRLIQLLKRGMFESGYGGPVVRSRSIGGVFCYCPRNGERPTFAGCPLSSNDRRIPMESHDGATGNPGHSAHHSHGTKPIDEGYRLVVRTILWVIAGLVLLGFGIWWIMT